VPSIPANLDWVFFTIGGVIALGAIWLLVWALFRDRARAKFRCPRCWYDLTAVGGAAPTVPVTCSECGRVITKAKHLRRTRRRWRYALLAAVVLVGSGVVAYYPSAHRNGWLSIVPTWFLIDSMPVFGYPSPLTDAFLWRHGVPPAHFASKQAVNWTPSGLGSDDHTYLLQRVARGNLLARPPDAAWQSSFGAFALDHPLFFSESSIASKSETIRAAFNLLRALPVKLAMRTRTVWPERVPMYVEIDYRRWAPAFEEGVLYVEDLELSRSYFPTESRWLVELNPRVAGSGTLSLLMEISLWTRATNKSFQAECRTQHVAVPYTIQGILEDIQTPLENPALDALVSQIEYTVFDSAQCNINPTRTFTTTGVGFGVLMEHTANGEVRAVERVWWLGGDANDTGNAGRLHREWITPNRMPTGGFSGTFISPQPGENWTVRIRSDPETALRVIDADTYRQGDVTIPLTIR
jgi:hypothetical protein